MKRELNQEIMAARLTEANVDQLPFLIVKSLAPTSTTLPHFISVDFPRKRRAVREDSSLNHSRFLLYDWLLFSKQAVDAR